MARIGARSLGATALAAAPGLADVRELTRINFQNAISTKGDTVTKLDGIGDRAFLGRD